VDVDCKIAAVLSRDEYKVANILITVVRDSGRSAAAVLLQQPLQFTHTASGQHNWPRTSLSMQSLRLGWMAGKCGSRILSSP
jgi:hypothetical protein